MTDKKRLGLITAIVQKGLSAHPCGEAAAYLLALEAVLAGNVIKYVWRFKHKNGVQDLEKAKWYLSRLIRHEKEGNQRENH